MATKAQKANLAAVKMLLKVLDEYPDRGAKVEAASDVAWMAASQDITPEDVVEGDPNEGMEYLRSLITLSEMSADVEEMAIDIETQETDNAKRWRSIRSRTIKSLL